MRKDIAEPVMMMAGLLGLAGLLSVGPCRAQSSAPSPQTPAQAVQPPSLGEVARHLKAERAQSREKPAKVYTNDDLKSGTGGISVVGPGPAPTTAAAAEADGSSEGASASQHDGPYYREKAGQLAAALQMHQRELSVLQQKLSLNQTQYYANPNDTLHQEYSRADINKLTQEIDAKKQQVEDDQQAVAALEQQVRREGGDPEWLRAGSTPPAAEASHASTVKPHSREEWQRALKEARDRLARAQEEQRLVEDELTLLQTQEARELATGNAGETASKITDQKAELDSKRAATEAAQKELDDLERKFQQSGAPGEQ